MWIFGISELNKACINKCCWFFISTNFIANKNSLTRIIKITLLLSIKSVFAVINNLWLIIFWSSNNLVFYGILIWSFYCCLKTIKSTLNWLHFVSVNPLKFSSNSSTFITDISRIWIDGSRGYIVCGSTGDKSSFAFSY